MEREKFTKAIDEDYLVVFTENVDGGGLSIQSSTAKRFFDKKNRYEIGTFIDIPNHNSTCSILDMFISEKGKTVFVSVKEACDCDKQYNCCDCGGEDCGCGYCFSCNACEDCLSE